MDTETLKSFIVVAEVLNFSKAADAIHITQPALSRRIAALEAEIGQELFLRTKPFVSLTRAGMIVLEKAQKICLLKTEMFEELNEMPQTVVEHLHVGYLNLSQFVFLSEIADEIRKRFPMIEIDLHQHTLPELRSKLKGQELDMIFDMLNEESFDADCVYQKAPGDERLYVVVPSNHPFAKRESLTFGEIRSERFVTFQRSTAPRIFDGFIHICMKNGFSPKITAYGQNMENVLMLVGMGKGMAVMDGSARILETKKIRFIPLKDVRLTMAWYLIHRKDDDRRSIAIAADYIRSKQADDAQIMQNPHN